jgi:hypothetical protein
MSHQLKLLFLKRGYKAVIMEMTKEKNYNVATEAEPKVVYQNRGKEQR